MPTRRRRALVESLPIAPSEIKDAALTELEHLIELVSNLSPSDWSRPSAVKSWTVGDVVAHLDLFLGMYSRFLGSILAGGGSSRVAKLIGWLTGSLMPSAAPVFDTINGALPKVVGSLFPPERVKRQFAASALSARDRLLEIGSGDYDRPVYFEGGPYPLSFYLGIVLNELAIHGWDIESAIADVAELSEGARSSLPWFYWSGTRLMFRPPNGTRGTVQVVLTNPESAMRWSVVDEGINLGLGRSPQSDAEISGPSVAYVLALAGRLTSADALRSLLTVHGDRDLAERFLGSWHLI